ncbi:histidine phosphatase family protein [Streptomyces actinomycinicus]|uniref:histidine phosphatase family protein n=1 Tax=Streptomyces actinomycinicus TaxID=1695166 RepID=UPI0027DA9D21|nr:histidine phosphatase family protein [Streptomyces actinomycinicus]
MRSPSAGSALTAAALGLEATVEPALRDIDYGTWRGRTAAGIAAADPHGYSAWLTDPDAAPHGGETVHQLCRRTAHWLRTLPVDSGRVLAVADPAVVQALLVHALSAPVRLFGRLRLPPLFVVCLTGCDGDWTVRSADASADRGPGRHLSLPLTSLDPSWRTAGDRSGHYAEHAA